MAELPSGSTVVVASAEVVFLNDAVFRSQDPYELGRRLRYVYRHPLPDEVLPEGKWIRFGYRSLTLALQPEEGEPFQLVFCPPIGQRNWTRLGGPIVTGEAFHEYSFNQLKVRRFIFPEDARETGAFFYFMSQQEVVALFALGGHGGAGGYDDYVAIGLKPEAGVLGRGQIGLLRNHGIGETYSALYELEGGNTTAGRGDHVGAYPSSHWGDDSGPDWGM